MDIDFVCLLIHPLLREVGRDPWGRLARATVRPSELLFSPVRCTAFHVQSSLLTCFLFVLSYFTLAVPMQKCSGEYFCTRSSFPVAILNGTPFFLRDEIVIVLADACEKLIRNYLEINPNLNYKLTIQTQVICATLL